MLAMTRIIQRCLFVLAFAGVLLSALETTAFDSIKSTDQTSSFTPESSSYAVEYSSLAPVVKAENESSDAYSLVSSPKPETSSYSESSIEVNSHKENSDNDITSSANSVNSRYNITESDTSSNDENSVTMLLPTLSHSEGILKSQIHDENLDFLRTNETSGDSSNSSEKFQLTNVEKHANIESEQNNSGNGLHNSRNENVSTASVNSETTTTETLETKESEMLNIDEMKSKIVTNNSGKSSVPSLEESAYDSRYIVSNQASEKIYSTAPSDVRRKNGITDPSSSTQKRSLHARNTATGSELQISILPTNIPTSSIPSQLPTDTENSTPSERANVKETTEEVLYVNSPHMKEQGDKIEVSSSHLVNSENTMNPSAMNTGSQNVKYQSENVAEMVLETSPSSVDGTHISSESSVALSTSRVASIHQFQSVPTIGQISHLSHISTMFPTSHRSHIELEDEPLTRSSEHEEALVTFDPNGMINNYTQDPDSVTFTPEIFHVDGMPTDAFLSRLETTGFLKNNSSEGHFKEGTANIDAKILSNFTGSEGVNFSEREREFIPSSQDLLPHDGPDNEELYDALRNTEPPMEDKSTAGSIIKTRMTESDKFSKSSLPFLDDESEEMLNDAPQFVKFLSTFEPTREIKKEEINILNKDLNMNVTNDISSITGSSPRSTPQVVNELDFSIVYQTEQSVIRPVTLASPSEFSSLLPSSMKVETFSSSVQPNSEQPDTVLPDISSPVILPNPAPSITNQSAEVTTTVLQPPFVPEGSVPFLLANDKESGTSQSLNSTIAGMAVKTSVSVSLPISVSNGSSISTENHAKDILNMSSKSDLEHPVPFLINNGADGNQSTSMTSEAPEILTTASTGLKILKVKINVPGSDNAPRTRKPFVPSLQRTTTTAGPPVSIFRKSKTRIQSITSSTTARPFPQFSTIRIHYASRIPGMVPGGELIISTEPITTTIPTTTETEEPFSDEPFTEQTQVPIVTNEDDVTLVKVAGTVVFEKGLRWAEQLHNRHSPQYKEKAEFVHKQLERLFRTSSLAEYLWKIQIDGFSSQKKSRSVAVDFFMYLVKTKEDIPAEDIKIVFHEKLRNNTFSRFTVDKLKTSFEFMNEEPLKAPTPPPEGEEKEPVIPQWAIAVIVVGAASLIFIILFAAVTIMGRHHLRRRYSNKLDEEDPDKPGDWESKMAAAYENLAADTIYDAEDLHSDTYKKNYNSTSRGRPTTRPSRVDSWSSSDWSPPPRRPRPQVHRIVY